MRLHRNVRLRLRRVLALIGGAAVAVGLMLWGFSNSVTYFVVPSELLVLPSAERVRVGGVVAAGSVSRRDNEFAFVISDERNEITVNYTGVLPDLFREGQTIIAEGQWDAPAQIMRAQTVLAKHDENYRPKALEDPDQLKGIPRAN